MDIVQKYSKETNKWTRHSLTNLSEGDLIRITDTSTAKCNKFIVHFEPNGDIRLRTTKHKVVFIGTF